MEVGPQKMIARRAAFELAPGGFINISQNAGKVIFLGTFTAGGLEVAIEGGQLHIVREGRVKKFVSGTVEHVTFSGEYAARRGQKVVYITERTVFVLTKEGLELIEIAPGIDLHSNVLDQMDFTPIMKGAPRQMDSRIFQPGAMDLKLLAVAQ